jgi:hypothetical protein
MTKDEARRIAANIVKLPGLARRAAAGERQLPAWVTPPSYRDTKTKKGPPKPPSQ